MFSLKRSPDPFFEAFGKSAKNAHQAAQLLRQLLHDFTDVPAKVAVIKDLEHANDRVTHDLADLLNQTFITPFDRQDIHLLSSRLDDVLDLVDSTAHRLLLYKVTNIYPDARALADVLVEATATLNQATHALRDLGRNREQILRACVDVNTSENLGDQLYHHGLGELFEAGPDPIDIIKWLDIYNLLEKDIDMCEDVANVIEGIVIKNS